MMLLDCLTDQQGNPLRSEPRAKYARLRVKKNAGPGAPPLATDPETGEPIVPWLAMSVGEFHKLVGGRPGQYRFDLLDEDYRVIDKDLVGWLTITESLRNSAAAAPAMEPDARYDRLIGVLEKAIDRLGNVADKLVEQRAGNVTAEAELVTANAEAIRAVSGSGLPLRPVATAETTTDDQKEEAEREPTIIESAAVQVFNAMEVWNETRKARIAAETAAKQPAPTPLVVTPVPEAPATPTPAAVPTPAASTSAATTPQPVPARPVEVPLASSPTPVNAFGLTDQQQAHLDAVLAKLTAREKMAAQLIVMRMSPEDRARWVPELSSLSVDDAVARVRESLPKTITGGAK